MASAVGQATIMLIAAVLVIEVSPSVQANAEQPPAATTDVKIDNLAFEPQALTVAVGTTVTWTNRDDIPHTVVSGHELLDQAR